MTIADVAAAYLNADLSAVPTSLTTKKPALDSWTIYKQVQLDENILRKKVEQVGGVGIITGYSNVECIDFDAHGHSWPRFRDLVNAKDPELLMRLYLERSPSGGYHLIYRCPALTGNAKLTTYLLDPTKTHELRHGRPIHYEVKGKKWNLKGSKKGYDISKNGYCELCAIETRGIGGFLVVAPTPGYITLNGDLTELTEITEDERAILINTTEEMSDVDNTVIDKGERGISVRKENEDKIGTWFNEYGDHKKVLEDAGWKYVGTKGGNERWDRPNHEEGSGAKFSATWHVEDRLFYVFSTSVPQLPSSDGNGRAYRLLEVYTRLHHEGSFKNACKQLHKDYPKASAELENKIFDKVIQENDSEGELRAILELDTGNKLEDIDLKHKKIIWAIRKYMKDNKLTFDALESIRRNGEMSSMSVPDLAREVTFAFRVKEKTQMTPFIETIDLLKSRDAIRRRGEIVGKLTGKPANPKGIVELEKFLDAVKEGWEEADKIALMHLIWNVKRKQLDLPGSRHHVVVLYNPAQDAGKSEAAKHFIRPWAELSAEKFEIGFITDERCTRMLSLMAIGNLDEMAGMERSDLNTLKSKITSEKVIYRPMKTNDMVMIPNRISFIGTTNEPVANIVRDVTGNRRFYQIETREKLKWDQINSVDYDLLWECVSEKDRSPGDLNRALLAESQKNTKFKDSIDEWMDGESKDAEIDANGDVIWSQDMCDAVHPHKGVVGNDLFRRYKDWCAMANLRATSYSLFFVKIKTLGWEMFKPHGGKRTYRLCDL